MKGESCKQITAYNLISTDRHVCAGGADGNNFPFSNYTFLNKPIRLLILSFFCSFQTILRNKNQQDLNEDHPSRRQVRWPLDHYSKLKFHLKTFSRLWRLHWPERSSPFWKQRLPDVLEGHGLVRASSMPRRDDQGDSRRLRFHRFLRSMDQISTQALNQSLQAKTRDPYFCFFFQCVKAASVRYWRGVTYCLRSFADNKDYVQNILLVFMFKHDLISVIEYLQLVLVQSTLDRWFWGDVPNNKPTTYTSMLYIS